MPVHEHSGEILPYEAIPKLGYSRAPGVPGQEAPGGSRGQHITCAHGGQKERRCREWLGGSVRLLKVPENGLQEKSRVIWQTSPEKRIHLGTLEWGKQGDWAGFRLGGDRFTKKTFTFGMLVKPLHNICSLWSWKKKKKMAGGKGRKHICCIRPAHCWKQQTLDRAWIGRNLSRPPNQSCIIYHSYQIAMTNLLS